jgi:hypothetical protein
MKQGTELETALGGREYNKSYGGGPEIIESLDEHSN